MKVKALNCPNCGAAVANNSNHCEHCRSRLKTMSCPSCFGTIFEGNKFCPLCGEKAIEPKIKGERSPGYCPRCKKKLQIIEVEEISLSECERCDGVWTDVETFEEICANSEKQANILAKIDEVSGHVKPKKIRYVPCPECKKLMNRSNFARSSGVIVDTCKGHGIWFDAEELPRIIDFIRKGGLDYARQKEKALLDGQKSRQLQQAFTYSVDHFKNDKESSFPASKVTLAIKEFIDFLID